MREPYPTDLSDAEWNYIQPHMPAPEAFVYAAMSRLMLRRLART
jgi:transposase